MRGLPKIPRPVRAISVIIGYVGALVGILYLPQDIGELPQALNKWGPVVSLLTREIALIAFSSLCVVWIAWTEIRPAVRRWLAEKVKHPLTLIPPGCELAYATRIYRREHSIYKITHAIAVRNDHAGGKTLRQLRAQLCFVGPPSRLRLLDSETTSIDLHAGSQATFEIGYKITEICDATIRRAREAEPGEFRSLLISAQSPAFHITPAGDEFGLSGRREAKYILRLVFTAEDMPPLPVALWVDPTADTPGLISIAPPSGDDEQSATDR